MELLNNNFLLLLLGVYIAAYVFCAGCGIADKKRENWDCDDYLYYLKQTEKLKGE